MLWRGAAALLLGVSTYFTKVAAQVITITQYPSTCSAVYTSGSRSVTVVQSTVTVQPIPWNDEMPNGGTPFVLQAQPQTAGVTAGQPRWVLPDGYLTTDGSQAAQFIIQNGQLRLTTGGFYSTFQGIPSATFAVSPIVGNINGTFGIVDGQLTWSNPAFGDGMAEFYQAPELAGDPPHGDPAHIVTLFYGQTNGDWQQYRLWARPVNAAIQGTSPLPGYSSTAVVSSIGGGMSSMHPPTGVSASANPYQTPSFSYQSTTESSGGQPLEYPDSSAASSQGAQSPGTSDQGSQPHSSEVQSSLPPTSTPTAPTSPDGLCGADVGFYCSGDNCCGQYGYCGTGADYCGDGCQPDFGTCWSVASSSLVVTTSSSGGIIPTSYPPGISIPSSPSPVDTATPLPDSIPATSVASSSSTRTYQPQQTYASCPDDDGDTVTDGYGTQYVIGCSKDTTIGSYSNQNILRGFNECFGLCDEQPQCMGWTYQGGVNGIGAGICYFKDRMVDFVPLENGDRYVGAQRVMAPSEFSSSTVASSTDVPPGYSTYTATATPIGPDNPGGPNIVTSSSSATDTGLTSAMSMSISMDMSMNTPSSSAALPTLLVSPNGHCGTQGNGGTPEGFTCTGSVFGTCCSNSGFCGSDSDYCLAGCQSGYGECTLQDGNPITANGECGVDSDNQTCTGGIFGACCSTSGFCGDGDDYCAPENCDSLFGTCDEDDSTSSTSMVAPSTSAPDSGATSPVSSDSGATSTPVIPSSTSSSTAPLETNSLCPSANGTTYTDPQGNQYTIVCGYDSDPGGVFQSLQLPSFTACINACLQQTDQVCVGITFGQGICSLKSYVQGWVANPGTDSAVLQPMNPPAYSSPSTTGGMMASSSSPVSSSSPFRLSSSVASSSPLGAPSTASSSSTLANPPAYGTTSSSSSPVAGIATTTSSSSTPSPTPSTTALSTTRTSTTTTTTTMTTTTSMTSSSSPAITTTTTSTTRTTTTTTSSSSSSSAYLVLPSPTPCDFGDPVSYDEDDSYCRIALPFSMRMYQASDVNTFAASNGYLSLTYGSSAYTSRQLPVTGVPPVPPNNTVAPFFDDLYISGTLRPRQGIWYQIQGTAVTYEWYTGRGGLADQIYHFTVKYDSAVPGVFTYTYYSTGGAQDQGLYAAIGSQGKNAAGAPMGVTYAYHVQTIAPGLVVVCDTNQNTCVTQGPP